MQARQNKHCIGGSKSRESVCDTVCVCVLFEFRQLLFFFTLGTRLRISKFCVDHCKKKSDRTRCLAFQFLSTTSDPKLLGPRYNIYWNSKSAERAKAFWFSEGRTK